MGLTPTRSTTRFHGAAALLMQAYDAMTEASRQVVEAAASAERLQRDHAYALQNMSRPPAELAMEELTDIGNKIAAMAVQVGGYGTWLKGDEGKSS